MEKLETIRPFTLAPWTARVYAALNEDKARERMGRRRVRIAVSNSGRNDLVGVGGTIELPVLLRDQQRLKIFSFTLGTRTEQSPYSGELVAIAFALGRIPDM